MILRNLTILLLWIGVAVAQHKCCDGTKNIIQDGFCIDGKNISGIHCKRRYLIISEDFTIDSEKQLVEDDTEVTSVERYCLTKEEETGPVVALVCFPENLPDDGNYFILKATCAMISVVFLLATFFVYMLVPELRDLQGKCLLNIIAFLALALFFLALMQFGISLSGAACYAIGYVTFTVFIITFTWLNVLSFHIWQTTVVPTMLGTKKQWEFIYYAYGYGIPMLLLAATLIGHHAPGNHIKPGIGENGCWFADTTSLWAYFYGPIAFFLICNTILFFFTIKKLWKDTKTVNCAKLKSLRYKCLMYTKLFFVMGLSWSFEVISFAAEGHSNVLDYVWMVTDFVNGLQGVLIFLILVVFRKRAIRGLAQKGLFCIKLPQQWKTLQDEECSEIIEEEKLAKVCVIKEQLQTKM